MSVVSSFQGPAPAAGADKRRVQASDIIRGYDSDATARAERPDRPPLG